MFKISTKLTQQQYQSSDTENLIIWLASPLLNPPIGVLSNHQIKMTTKFFSFYEKSMYILNFLVVHQVQCVLTQKSDISTQPPYSCIILLMHFRLKKKHHMSASVLNQNIYNQPIHMGSLVTKEINSRQQCENVNFCRLEQVVDILIQ